MKFILTIIIRKIKELICNMQLEDSPIEDMRRNYSKYSMYKGKRLY